MRFLGFNEYIVGIYIAYKVLSEPCLWKGKTLATCNTTEKARLKHLRSFDPIKKINKNQGAMFTSTQSLHKSYFHYYYYAISN